MQEELLADLPGTVAFKDFVLSRGYKMPSVSTGSFQKDLLRGSQLLMEGVSTLTKSKYFSYPRTQAPGRKGVFSPERGPETGHGHFAVAVLPIWFLLCQRSCLAADSSALGLALKGPK